MTGAQEAALLLRSTPPFPELAAELVAAGGLALSGAGSLWMAAVHAARTAGGAVRRARSRQDDRRRFRAIVRADPELRALARDGRRIARNWRWVHGGPGRAEVPGRGCAVTVAAVCVAAGLVIGTVLRMREAAAVRREGRRK